MDWLEVVVTVGHQDGETAAAVVQMAASNGIYIEDYREMEDDIKHISHIDLIDEALLKQSKDIVKIHGYFHERANPAEALAFIKGQMDAVGIPYQIDEKGIQEEDWANNWKKYYKPFPVGEKLYIKPEWEPLTDVGERLVLNISPGLAFGTGTHESTAMCLLLAEKYVQKNNRVLDIGCGSGILFVASLLLGAGYAKGIDLDPMAVKIAAENARLNNFDGNRFQVEQGNLANHISEKYQIVFANIVADVIVELSVDLERVLDKNGIFITSGIISGKEEMVIEALQKAGMTILEQIKEKDWVAIAAIRP